jgi:SAM-dependent methyltransferase
MPIQGMSIDPGNLLMLQERERALAGVLRKANYRTLEGVRIFEAGAGLGYNLRQFTQWGAHPGDIAAIEIDRERVDYTRAHTPGTRIHLGSAEQIPEGDREFDICVAFRLFSSLHNEDMSEGIASEMFRITKPGGLIVVYDIRRKSIRTRDIQAVEADDVRRWFPKCRARTQHLSLGTKTAALAGKVGPAAYGLLALFPPLLTHSLHVMRRPAISPFDEDGWDGRASE